MNLLFIDQFAGYHGASPEWEGPDSGLFSAVGRHHALARELSALGANVGIATSCPAPPDGGKDGDGFFTVTREGVTYLLFPSPMRLPGEHLRLGSALGFSGSLGDNAAKVAAMTAPAAVISASLAPFDFGAAAKVASLSGARLVWEMTAIEPDSLIRAGKLARFGPAALFLLAARARAVRRADVVVSPLITADTWMERMGAPDKLRFIPEAAPDYDSCPCDEALPAVDFITKLRGEGKFVIAYAGEMSRAAFPETLLRAVRELGDGYAAAFAGDGGQNVLLKREARDTGMQNAYFFDGLSPAGGQAFCAAADCSFAPETETGLPVGELLPRMMAGRPVIYAGVTPPAILAKTGCGLSCPPRDPKALAQAAARLRAFSGDELDAAGKAGRDYALERHTPAKQAERWLRLLTELTEGTK